MLKSKPTKSEILLEIDDAIILLLGTRIKGLSHNPELKGITRLEKLMFLIGKETQAMNWLKDNFEFEAAPFGPFSSKLYQTVDMLLSAELIKERRTISVNNLDSWEEENLIGIENNSCTMRNFNLTQRGEEYYNSLVKDIDKKTLEKISSFKNTFAFLPIRLLVRYTYSMYPEYTKS